MPPHRTAALLLSAALLAVIVLGGEQVAVKGRTLVVVEDMGLRVTHSLFFDGLLAMGQELTFQKADDPALTLTRQGEFFYDNLVLFAPTTEGFGGDLDVPGILEFIDSGRNAIVAASPGISESLRELAGECGVEFEDQHTHVIDHFNFDVEDADGDHTLIAADKFIDSPVILGGNIGAPVLYDGVAHTLRADNEFVVPVLSGSPSAYSHSPDEAVTELPRAVGTDVVLVSAMQARNNARIVFAGSLDMFSNKYGKRVTKPSLKNRLFSSIVHPYGSEKTHGVSGNRDFCLGLAGWVMKERGVLRFHSFDYRRPNDTTTPRMVTIEEQIKCTITVEERSTDGAWAPYDADDIAIEFVMLDPHERGHMKHNGGGHYSYEFRLPDVYGIFKWRLWYRRLGYTFLDMEETLPVRPYRHTEYERFIPAAFPYYASAFSMIVGVLLFSAVFLYGKH